jgi:hypothetical protein
MRISSFPGKPVHASRNESGLRVAVGDHAAHARNTRLCGKLTAASRTGHG